LPSDPTYTASATSVSAAFSKVGCRRDAILCSQPPCRITGRPALARASGRAASRAQTGGSAGPLGEDESLVIPRGARHGWNWGQLRRHLNIATGRWRLIAADGIEYFRIQGVTVSRYAYRGNKIPTLGRPRTTPNGSHCGEPVANRSARRVRRAALGKRTGGNAGTAPWAESTTGSPQCHVRRELPEVARDVFAG
jgi:hypothetical protein